MAQQPDPYVAEWRALEDRFYRGILSDPELYMLGIRLVRALADSLAGAPDLAGLVARFEQGGADEVVPVADELGAPQVMLLDYQLARGAAFYLRAQDLQAATAEAQVQALLAAARAQGQRWAVLADQQMRRYGRALFQRIEMRLDDGLSLRSASEMDWERGLVYVAEVLLLDPASGRPRRDAAPPQPRQEFATAEQLEQALAALRAEYA